MIFHVRLWTQAADCAQPARGLQRSLTEVQRLTALECSTKPRRHSTQFAGSEEAKHSEHSPSSGWAVHETNVAKRCRVFKTLSFEERKLYSFLKFYS